MRKILAFILAVSLLGGCKKYDNSMYIPPYGQDKGDSTEQEKGSDVDDDIVQDNIAENEMKVMSFNVRLACDSGDRDWEVRKYAIPDLIYKENPTVFGVQEALTVQLVYLREQCPEYKDIGVGRDDGRSAGEHMNIFYNTKRTKLEDWGYFWLSETPNEPSYGWGESYRRIATWAIFTNLRNSEKFFYMNTHGPLNGTANANAMKLIAQKLKELNPDGYPAMLTADFNIEADNSNFAPIRLLMKNARETAPVTDNHDTFNGWGEGSGIIDHIWYSGFAEAESYRTVTDVYRNITYVSDHYPIVATLVFD